MDAMSWCRMALIYVHLLLAAFALRAVLHTDLLVLSQRVVADDLEHIHQHLLWLLGALWLSGLGVAAIDLDFDIGLLPTRPKLMAKLTSVSVLTLNGLLLRHWCFPRLSRGRTLGAGEHSLLMVIGAISSASWLMAAFIGIARPLRLWQTWEFLALYGAALSAAALGALLVGAVMRRVASVATFHAATSTAARTVHESSMSRDPSVACQAGASRTAD